MALVNHITTVDLSPSNSGQIGNVKYKIFDCRGSSVTPPISSNVAEVPDGNGAYNTGVYFAFTPIDTSWSFPLLQTWEVTGKPGVAKANVIKISDIDVLDGSQLVGRIRVNTFYDSTSSYQIEIDPPKFPIMSYNKYIFKTQDGVSIQVDDFDQNSIYLSDPLPHDLENGDLVDVYLDSADNYSSQISLLSNQVGLLADSSISYPFRFYSRSLRFLSSGSTTSSIKVVSGGSLDLSRVPLDNFVGLIVDFPNLPVDGQRSIASASRLNTSTLVLTLSGSLPTLPPDQSELYLLKRNDYSQTKNFLVNNGVFLNSGEKTALVDAVWSRDTRELSTSGNVSIANEVERQIIDDTDTEKVLKAITDKISSSSITGPDAATIATAVVAAINSLGIKVGDFTPSAVSKISDAVESAISSPPTNNRGIPSLPFPVSST